MVKYLSFHNSSSSALRYLFNVKGKATVWHTPCFSLQLTIEGKLALQTLCDGGVLKLWKVAKETLSQYLTTNESSWKTLMHGFLRNITYLNDRPTWIFFSVIGWHVCQHIFSSIGKVWNTSYGPSWASHKACGLGLYPTH